ncbi:MAG: hypothetical protein JWR67_1152, partial [Mucilaginibacter sp.]|nr:hypothetical protein [Mucilaginibacter sp.]
MFNRNSLKINLKNPWAILTAMLIIACSNIATAAIKSYTKQVDGVTFTL